MYAQIFAVIAPIFICAFVGYVWALRKLPYDAEFVSRLVMIVGAPCLIISSLSKVNVSSEHLLALGVATVLGLLSNVALSTILLRLIHRPVKVYLPPMLFPNCGNMGLPVCLFAFGETGLGMSLVIFMVTALIHFSLGVAWLSGGHVLKSLLRTPVVYAAALSFTMIVTQQRLPLWLDNTVGLLGDMSIPLMLVSLGVSLRNLHIKGLLRSVLFSAWRLGVGFTLGLLVCWLFDFKGTMAGVVLIQFSMPAAVFNYLLAQRYQYQPEEVAGIVVVSTCLSFLSLPALLWFVYQL